MMLWQVSIVSSKRKMIDSLRTDGATEARTGNTTTGANQIKSGDEERTNNNNLTGQVYVLIKLVTPFLWLF